MAANRRPGGVSFELFSEPPAAPAVVSTAVSTDEGRPAQEIAASLDRLSARIAERARVQEQDEGREAGALAGFDPEFRELEGNGAFARAFNAAGRQSFLTQLETDTRARFDELFLEHGHDPVRLRRAFDSYEGEQRASEIYRTSPELLAQFEALSARTRLGYERQSARAQIQAAAESSLAEIGAYVDARLNGLDRLAREAGLDETADAALAAELENLQSALISYGPREAFTLNGVSYEPDGERTGAMDPVRMQEVLSLAQRTMTEARVMGAFARTQGLTQRRAFLSRFAEDTGEAGGPYGDLDRTRIDRMISSMQTEITREENERETHARRLEREIERQLEAALRGQEDIAQAGLTAPSGVFSAIVREARAAGLEDLAAEAAEAGVIAELQRAASRHSPVELQQFINTERARLEAAEATPFEARRLTAMEDVLGEMNAALSSDPLSWAVRSGTASVPPLEMTDAEGGVSMDVFASSLRDRVAIGQQVAARYGIAPAYFLDEEVDALTVQIERGEASRLALASAFVEGFGPEAPAALAQISSRDELLAHVGGLVSQGAIRAAGDVEAGHALSRSEGFVSRLAPEADREARMRRTYGDISTALPQTAARAMAAADLMFEARAARGGWQPGSQLAQYERALQEALGARYRPGRFGEVRFGGTAAHNGRDVIAPGWLRHDRLDDVVSRLAEGSLGGPRLMMQDADGRPIEADALANARLISIAEGRYLVDFSRGNDDPAIAMNAAGEPYELDLSAWRQAIARDEPEWVMQ